MKVNRHTMALGQLLAKLTHRCFEPQQFESRGVKAVRQHLNIGHHIRNLFAGCPDLLREFSRRSRRTLLQVTKMNAQQHQPLVDVIVKLAGDPAALFIVRFDQFPTHRGKRLLGQLPLGDVAAVPM